MSFEKLIGSMELMSKAQTLDDTNKDAKVAQAAAEGAAAGASDDGDKGGENGAGGESGTSQAAAGSPDADGGEGAAKGEGGSSQEAENLGSDEEMAKSFSVVLEDGTTIEAMDGTSMLKALGQRLGAVGQRLTTTEDKVKEALGKAILLIGGQSEAINTLSKSLESQGALVTEQADLIKSLRSDIDAVRSQPAGRKSITNLAQVSGTDPLVKSMGDGTDDKQMAPQEFLAKCLDLQKTGEMSLQDVVMAETSLGNNVAIPAHIVKKVFSSK